MKRYLDFFDPNRDGSTIKPLERAVGFGAHKALVVGTKTCDIAIAKALREAGVSAVEKQLASFEASDITDADVVLICDGSAADVSRALHACIGAKIATIAPVTEHHYRNRTLFLISIPKAGTHMVIRLLGLMGLDRSPDRAPRPGTWCTPVGYEYHTPCRELMANDWFDPIGRQLLFRSPVIFVYRNPLDIIVSELDWFVRPDHAFSGYLNSCADKSEQLDRLIADQSVMGNIRDRINRYTGWVKFENVVPVSYEELVGSRGSGSDADQEDSIWALQLKLHIPGDPSEYAKHVYDPTSATFSAGRIGRHLECFEERHFSLLGSLQQDFMEALGYSRGAKTSSRVIELRRRPLAIKELHPDILHMPRLVRESVMGWNIIEVAGKYFPIRQGEQIMSAADAASVLAAREGFVTLGDAMDAAIHGSGVTAVATETENATEPKLVTEGYWGFNVICHSKNWYGIDQAAGNLDIGRLGKLALERMKRNGTCVTGESYADVKAEILRLVTRERRKPESSAQLSEQQTGTKSQMKDSQEHVSERVSANRLESIKEPLLLEGNCRGFNLVAYNGRVWAAAMAVGPIDLQDVDVRGRLMAEGQLLEAITVEGARAAIDARLLEERVRAMETRLDEVNALMSEVKLSKQVAEDATRDLDTLRSQLVETATSLEKLRAESQQGYPSSARSTGANRRR